MSFLAPGLLLFGLAALVPLALHLIGRRRAREVPFTAMSFLLSRDPRRARALRVEQRLLVALRMGAAALVALTLAQPMLPDWRSDEAVLRADAPVSVAVVLDNSLSMGAKTPDGRTRLAVARDMARRLLSRLPPGSRAGLVRSARPAVAVSTRLSADLGSVMREIDAVSPGAGADDAGRALALARRLVAMAPERERRVVILSDLQASGWRRVVDGDLTGVRVFQVGEPVDDTEIVDATVSSAPDRGPQQVRVHVTLKRHGTTPWRGHVSVSVGGREVRTWVELAPGTAARHAFVVPLVAEVAEVRIAAGDRQPGNDVRVLRLRGSASLKVRVVNGAPRPIAREDEVFFFVRALEAAAERSSELQVETRRLGALSGPEDWDVLVLANVPELPKAALDRIDARVRAGAGVLVTVGDGVPEPATRWLEGLLPVELATASDLRGLAGLRGAEQAVPGLDRAEVRRRWLVKPSAKLRDWTRLRYGDGAPALLVAPRGAGRVALWTTTLDRDWSNLPLQPGWLPLVRRMVFACAAQGASLDRSEVEVGEGAVLPRHPKALRLELRQGDRVLHTLEARSQPAGLWRLPQLPEPGAYEARETQRRRFVIVRPPARESAPALLAAPPTAPGDAAGGAAPKVPAWGAALGLLLALLVGEAALLLRSR